MIFGVFLLFHGTFMTLEIQMPYSLAECSEVVPDSHPSHLVTTPEQSSLEPKLNYL